MSWRIFFYINGVFFVPDILHVGVQPVLYWPIAIIQLPLEGPSLDGKACRAAFLSSFSQVPQEVTVQLGAETERKNVFVF